MNTVEIEHGEKENNGQMFPLPHNVKSLSSSNFVNNTNIANFLYDKKSLHKHGGDRALWKIENNGKMFPLPHFQFKSVNIFTSLTSKLKTYLETCFLVFTARKRSCGKVMFLHLSVSHSVHRERGLCMMSLPVWLPGSMFL